VKFFGIALLAGAATLAAIQPLVTKRPEPVRQQIGDGIHLFRTT
jgi:hypothetical protein